MHLKLMFMNCLYLNEQENEMIQNTYEIITNKIITKVKKAVDKALVDITKNDISS